MAAHFSRISLLDGRTPGRANEASPDRSLSRFPRIKSAHMAGISIVIIGCRCRLEGSSGHSARAPTLVPL